VPLFLVFVATVCSLCLYGCLFSCSILSFLFLVTAVLMVLAMLINLFRAVVFEGFRLAWC
jgi:hypothetical protein